MRRAWLLLLVLVLACAHVGDRAAAVADPPLRLMPSPAFLSAGDSLRIWCRVAATAGPRALFLFLSGPLVTSSLHELDAAAPITHDLIVRDLPCGSYELGCEVQGSGLMAVRESRALEVVGTC